jgi:sec-independent protein translocase protein TatA
MNDAMLAMLQTPEIIGLLVLALIFFGAKKLPELARGLGSGIKEFKKATRDVTDELQSAIDAEPAPPRRPIPPPESQPVNPGAGISEASETIEEVETAAVSASDSSDKPGA